MEVNEFRQLYNLILSEQAVKADAIIWLQGDRFNRSQKVLELYQAGYSDKIIITGNNVLVGAGKRPGENNISLDEMRQWLLAKGVPESAILVDENSMNTKEQAENIIALAKNNDWKTFILVGSSYYQPRAFLTFLKVANKLNYQGRIVNQPALILENDIPEGRSETAGALMAEELMKLEKYGNDLESVAVAINYLSKNL